MGRWLLCMVLTMFASAVSADTVSMAFGNEIPPFCFPATNTGIELEVIGAALAKHGHVLKPQYYPLKRVPIAFKSKLVDAAQTDLGQDLRAFGGYYANPAVTYDNVFITLKSRHLRIRKPSDLKGLSIISFAGAAERYKEWLEPVRKAGNYTEMNDQLLQVKTLNESHYDVVLSDKTIFKYFSHQLEKEQGIVLKPVEMQAFTTVNPMDYRPVFRSKQIRDDFNDGLLTIQKNGQYQAIYDKYLLK